MSIAAAVLDFYDDAQHELMSKVASPADLGDTQIAILSSEERDRLPDSEFGLVLLTKRASVLRKFPLNDPGNAWLSSQYFANTHKKLAFPARFIAASHIKQACDAYGVPPSSSVAAYAARAESTDIQTNTFTEGSESGWMLKKLAQRELSMDKTASASFDALAEMPNEHFALVVQQGDGEVIRKYAMPDPNHVQKAAAYFDKYAMDLAPEYRHQFAQSVQARAAELDVDVSGSELLQKWAGSDWNPHLEAHLEQRKSLLPHNEKAHDVLNKLAASLDRTTPEHVAQVLTTFDDATGISRYYDRGLTDPYSSAMAKVAESWSAEVEGNTLTSADLRKVAASPKLASYMGQAFAGQFQKDAEAIFESLPTPEKIVIKKLATGEL